MQEQKFVLPSPNFNIQKPNKLSQSQSNFAATQAKCLYNKKLWSEGNTAREQYGQRSNNNSSNNSKGYQQQQNKSREIWCEACDRGFRSLDELNKHTLEHKKCGINGCTFVAHPTIVSKHIAQQHASGLFDKIQKLSTPEEIAKWREERKKRYPTRVNIELRQKAQEEKRKRGERLEDPKSRFGRKHDRRQMRNYENKSSNRHHNYEQQQQKRDNEEGTERKKTRWKGACKYKNRFNRNKKFSSPSRGNTEKKPSEKETVEKNLKVEDKIENQSNDLKEDDEECTCKIPRFQGTRNLIGYKRSKEKKKIDNPLINLLGMYGSDDEFESESGEELSEPEAIINSDNQLVEIQNQQINEVVNSIGTPGKRSSSDETEEVPCKKIKSSNEVIKLSTFGRESFEVESIQETNKEAETNCDDSFNERPSSEILQEEKVNDSSSENEMPEEIPIIKEDLNASNLKPVVSQVIQAPKSNTSRLQNSKERTTRNQIKTLLNYSALKRHRSNTLLEKLLQPCIRHERNVLLQCVRFVVENNFFGIGGKETSS